MISLWNGFKSLNGKRFVSDVKGGDKCELKIINNSVYDIIECWVQPNGLLKNYSQINNNSIRDGSTPNHVTINTFQGHAFVFYKRTSKRPHSVLDIRAEAN